MKKVISVLFNHFNIFVANIKFIDDVGREIIFRETFN